MSTFFVKKKNNFDIKSYLKSCLWVTKNSTQKKGGCNPLGYC